jgi:hypothetical protein
LEEKTRDEVKENNETILRGTVLDALYPLIPLAQTTKSYHKEELNETYLLILVLLVYDLYALYYVDVKSRRKNASSSEL